MTPSQARFVELERQLETVKKFKEELNGALQAVADEIGVDSYFQADDGIVYKVVVPKGQWVEFRTVGFERTKRNGEAKGSLSVKEAREQGFTVG